MNINKKIATQVFSRVTCFQDKHYKGRFSNNGQFNNAGYPLEITYKTNCGYSFVAWKITGINSYEVFPTIGNSIIYSSFYVYI